MSFPLQLIIYHNAVQECLILTHQRTLKKSRILKVFRLRQPDDKFSRATTMYKPTVQDQMGAHGASSRIIWIEWIAGSH